MLRINESLYHLLGNIRDGGGIYEFMCRNPVMNQENILKVLLMLVGGGYLKLIKVQAANFPYVSAIIPVRDDPDNLEECIKSLENLNYPEDRMEIIVVDDGSKQEISQIIQSPGIRILRNDISKGPAACRNAGAAAARGDVYAFLDADCVAGENWLLETVPFFRAVNAGAVGGCVDGYYHDKALDRYEKAFSSLNMGRRFMMEGKSGSGFYVPTANMLVGREAFWAAGGFNEKMRIGEDVDFCWRLRDLGHTLIYVPFGKVAHKHRSRLGQMLSRRADYGKSEALLYGSHRDKKKRFDLPVFSALSFLALCAGVLLRNPYPLAAIPLFFIIDLFIKSSAAGKIVPVPFSKVFSSALRSHLSFFYYAFFHVIRYYLILFILFGILWYPVWVLGALGLILASIVDYVIKKPALLYPVFLFFYILEHLAYQTGVLLGCFKYRYFGSYRPGFTRRR